MEYPARTDNRSGLAAQIWHLDQLPTDVKIQRQAKAQKAGLLGSLAPAPVKRVFVYRLSLFLPLKQPMRHLYAPNLSGHGSAPVEAAGAGSGWIQAQPGPTGIKLVRCADHP